MSLNEDDLDDQLLVQANKLNSDLGRFVRSCSFSSQLTGRFYQNNSMETHTAREQRIARMKAKRKKLEQDVKVEDAKIRYLEKLLQWKEEKQRASTLFQAKANAAARTIQSFARVCLAKKQLELLRVERNIIIYVALFLQSLYRGLKGRQRVEWLKSENRKHALETAAAIQLQQHARCFLARRQLLFARKERDDLIHFAASKIQSLARSKVCKLAFRREYRRRLECTAAIRLQCWFRGLIARRIAQGIRRERRRKKPEKAPSLYDRRYSTYSVKTVISRKPRRQSAGTVASKDDDNQTTHTALSRPQSNKHEMRPLNAHKMVTSGVSHPNQDKDYERKSKATVDQVVTLAQQKASERVAASGRRAKQEKKKQQLEFNKIHEKLKQLERNRKGRVTPSLASAKRKVGDHSDSVDTSEGMFMIQTPLYSDGNKLMESDDEFEELIPENENDID